MYLIKIALLKKYISIDRKHEQLFLQNYNPPYLTKSQIREGKKKKAAHELQKLKSHFSKPVLPLSLTSLLFTPKILIESTLLLAKKSNLALSGNLESQAKSSPNSFLILKINH
jgi:hypothetical protein